MDRNCETCCHFDPSHGDVGYCEEHRDYRFFDERCEEHSFTKEECLDEYPD
jgi:hypothetical protein